MHKHKWVIPGLIIALAVVSLVSSGCGWHRTRQGWITGRSNWSLEYRNRPSACDASTQCSEECVAGAAEEPSCTCQSDDEEVLYHANPKLLEKLSNSSFARAMERRGRLGLCASCGRLARFKDSIAKQDPPEPVIAKFHPVPTQPIFSPREAIVQSVYNDMNPLETEGKAARSPAKSRAQAYMPEVIPAPPETTDKDTSTTAVPRRIDAPRELSSWIFSTPNKSTPVVEAPMVLPRDPDRTARRQ